MGRLPATRHIWMLVLLISLGGFFEVYDLIFTGYIAPGMAKSGLLQTSTETFFGSPGIAGSIAATFAGLFVGTFFLGWLPDKMLLVSQGVTVTKSLLHSFVIAIALPTGPLPAMLYADKVQRKWLIVVSALTVIVFGILFGRG